MYANLERSGVFYADLFEFYWVENMNIDTK